MGFYGIFVCSSFCLTIYLYQKPVQFLLGLELSIAFPTFSTFCWLTICREDLINKDIERSVARMQSVIELGRVVRDRKTMPVKVSFQLSARVCGWRHEWYRVFSSRQYPLPEVVVIHQDQQCLDDVMSLEKYILEVRHVCIQNVSLYLRSSRALFNMQSTLSATVGSWTLSHEVFTIFPNVAIINPNPMINIHYRHTHIRTHARTRRHRHIHKHARTHARFYAPTTTIHTLLYIYSFTRSFVRSFVHTYMVRFSSGVIAHTIHIQTDK